MSDRANSYPDNAGASCVMTKRCCDSCPRTEPLRVLLGPIFDDPAESVSTVNRTFVQGMNGGIQLIGHQISRRYGSDKPGLMNGVNVLYSLQHLWIWNWLLFRRRPCVAHYAVGRRWNLEKGLLFLWWARLRGVHTVAHLHSGGFVDFWRGLPAWRQRLARRQMRHLDAVIVLSDALKAKLVEVVGLPPDQVRVVNNPIDPDFEAAALQLPLERPHPVVLGMGVMDKDKGVFDLVRAVAQVSRRRPVRLILAGPDREPGISDKVRQLARELGIQDNVELTGEVWGDCKLELFRSAAVLALPSYRENFPLTVLEAAAAGTAVIATPQGATPEFFEHGRSALFVPPGDVDALTQSLLQLLDQPDRRVALARTARAVFQNQLNRERIMAQLSEAYFLTTHCPQFAHGEIAVTP